MIFKLYNYNINFNKYILIICGGRKPMNKPQCGENKRYRR